MSEARRQTIFRRVRAPGESFTVVNNSIVDDPELDLDELGALLKLLRKPGDWVMLPKALRKEFGIGRDRFYRIMRRLRQVRYAHYAEQHSENGEFEAGVYSIYDGKCAPVSEIDVRSGAAAEGASDNPDTVNPDVGLSTVHNQLPPYPPARMDRSPVAGSDRPGLVDSKSDAPSRRGVFIDDPHGRTSSAVLAQPPPAFAEFIARWKPGPTESLAAAERNWRRLSDEAKRKACAYIATYNAACKAAGQRRCHAKSYLRNRYFEAAAASAQGGGSDLHEIKAGTRAAGFWALHYAETNQRWRAEEMGRKHLAGQPWFERSEFPPEKGET